MQLVTNCHQYSVGTTGLENKEHIWHAVTQHKEVDNKQTEHGESGKVEVVTDHKEPDCAAKCLRGSH